MHFCRQYPSLSTSGTISIRLFPTCPTMLSPHAPAHSRSRVTQLSQFWRTEQDEKVMHTLEKGKADSGKWVEWEQLPTQSCLQSSSELMFATVAMSWPSEVEQVSPAMMQGRMDVEFSLGSQHETVVRTKLSVGISKVVISSPMARQ